MTTSADQSVAQGTQSTAPGVEHDPEAKRKIVNRLRRAQGQLNAVVEAIERDAHCRDVVQQLSAVSKAIDRAGFLVISTALRECLTNPDAEGGPDRDELEKLFLSLA
ncbi:metal-sensitive transcriptional regulator [Leucobacter salsicius]|uniref:metal-sensitive transcriptional regulator n=1 Tax=Leucobacter salsicius TaxID=664638 RepID=UPI000347DB7A|nr:metal-sensitive transcriptional regulator [Leucobacter salsicius]